MLKKWLVGLMACAALMGARTVAVANIDFDQGIDVKGIVQSLQAQAKTAPDIKAGKAKLANWTIMVYVNAKNNLEKFGLANVNDMEKVGSTDKVKVAVELGRMGSYDNSDGGWKGERRYIIQKDNDPQHISSPVLQEFDKADMGDWRHLVDFVNWAKATAPAQHYMLIVWNHGSGWDKFQKASEVVIHGISYDDESGNHMSTQDLGQALATVGKIDIYASDACLMQMAEVDYQIHDYADYIVGSEETEPGDGYTYDAFLGPIAAKPGMAADEVAKIAVKSYAAHYEHSGEAATQAAVRAAAIPQLLALASDWSAAVMAANETALVASARSQAQSFYVSDNKDLLHYVRLIDAGTQNAAVKSKGAELESFLTNSVIIANAEVGDDHKNANGLAIYVPSYSYNANYDELAWAKDGGWARFAQWQKNFQDASNNGGGGNAPSDSGGPDDSSLR